MKKAFENLNMYTKTFAVAFGTGVLVSLVLLILGLNNILSLFIPLGVFLGSFLSSFSYFVLGKLDSIEIDPAKKTKFTIVIIYVRLFLLLALVVLEAFLQLKANIMLFNAYAFLGGYLFTSLVFGVFYFGRKKC